VGPDGISCQPYGEMYRSSDGGVTWTTGSVILRGGGLLMPDSDHAWMPDACLTEQCDSAQLLVTSDGGAVYRSRVGSHRRELDPVLRTLFAVRAGSTLRAVGYK